MLVIFPMLQMDSLLFFMFLMIMPSYLHSLQAFLLKRLHPGKKAVGIYIPIISGKKLLHPHIGFAPCIEEQVAFRNPDDIPGRRLVGMSFHSGLQQHIHFHIFAAYTADKIKGRKDSRYYLYLRPAVRSCFLRRLLLCVPAAAVQCQHQQEKQRRRKNDSCPFLFHFLPFLYSEADFFNSSKVS